MKMLKSKAEHTIRFANSERYLSAVDCFMIDVLTLILFRIEGVKLHPNKAAEKGRVNELTYQTGELRSF